MKTAADVSSKQEDYLEAILRLIRSEGRARVGDVAASLGVHKSTVTAALHLLHEKGLVLYAPYADVTLTDRGRAVAARVAGDHAVIREFLQDVLCIPRDTAEVNACRMEHAMDGRVLAHLGALVEHMQSWRSTDEGAWRRFRRRFRRHLRRRVYRTGRPGQGEVPGGPVREKG